jgi:phage terminase Nu1 subunit (DNA packaging protein)
MADLVAINVVCRWLGIGARRVQVMVSEGLLPRPERGQYDLEACVRAYCAFLRSRPGHGRDRDRLHRARAELAELELQRQRGDIVAMELVTAALERTFGAMASRINSLPARFAPIVCPGDPKRGQRVLEAVVSEMRADMRAFSLRPGAGG